jgi:hypothetical protein
MGQDTRTRYVVSSERTRHVVALPFCLITSIEILCNFAIRNQEIFNAWINIMEKVLTFR